MINFHIFPFWKVKQDSKVIIYGFGLVGKEYFNQVRDTKYCKVLFAVDKNYKEIYHNEVNIFEPLNIINCEYDSIVIANGDSTAVNEIITYLLEMGVDEQKIVWEDHLCTLPENNVNLSEIKSMIEINQRMLLGIEAYCENTFMLRNGVDINKSQQYYYLSKLYNLLEIKDIKDSNKKFIRLGNRNGDGGYTMLEDFDNRKVAYSFGISNDVSWDLDMAERGFSIYMYDHTITKLPCKNEMFHFYQTGITGDKDEKDNRLKTLDEIINQNGHQERTDMILKMDVEGYEWNVLKNIETKILNQFSQIVLELHDLNRYEKEQLIFDALNNINKTHQLVHIHANNYSFLDYVGDLSMSNVVEVLYIRKSDYEFTESNRFLPADTDVRCLSTRKEYIFGKYNRDN